MSKNFSTAVAEMDSGAVDIHEAFGGLTRVGTRGRSTSPEWQRGLLECERFMEDLRTGRRDLWQFQEAMSTSDFPAYFADSLDRQLYGAYEATTPTWQNYARASTVNDFREVTRFATDGVRGLLTEVGELAEHKRRAMSLTPYQYKVKKYEAGFALSFEMMINDDLNAFLRMPQDLADSARDSEEEFVTRLFVDANGPHASVYTVGNDNIITGNPVLSRESLQAALVKLSQRKDEKGNPIQIRAVELVVGSSLAMVANEITEASEYRLVGANGDVTVIKGNGVAANLRTNVNYWLDTVASNANGATSWFLFASTSSVRPAMEFGRLRGYEAPALYEKVPDMRRLGGGEVPWSFDHGSVERKIQHIYGGAIIDTKMTLASQGDGN